MDDTAHLNKPSGPSRIALSRGKALLIATVSFGITIVVAWALFRLVEQAAGYDDDRDGQVAMIFAAVMGMFWLGSIVTLFRKDRIFRH